MTLPVWATLVGIALATFTGASLQRIAGMGLGLIAAPALSVLLITVSVLLLAALSVVTLGKHYVPNIEGTVPAIAAGAVGGVHEYPDGVAGPAVTVYAHAARWPKDIYAATLQPIFLVGGVLSFAVKVLTGAADFTAVTAGVWGAGVGGDVRRHYRGQAHSSTRVSRAGVLAGAGTCGVWRRHRAGAGNCGGDFLTGRTCVLCVRTRVGRGCYPSRIPPTQAEGGAHDQRRYASR